MDFLTLAKSRCTTRGFMDKKIAGEDLERILEAGRLLRADLQGAQIIDLAREAGARKVYFASAATSSAAAAPRTRCAT